MQRKTMKRKLKVSIMILVMLIFSITTMISAEESEGGKMVVSFQSDLATLDPAIGYDWQNWSIIKSIFNGLMDYEPGTTDLKTQLAESYSVSDDGKTYTFTIRDDILFHNGRPMTAEDVKYSFERVLNPETQSPGAGFYLNILGAEEYSNGESEEVSGIEVLDSSTIEFTLIDPNAAFLHTLALNFSFVVPQEEVEKYGMDFGHHPVGTGAFKFNEWILGQHLSLLKNEKYYIPERPKLDEIYFQFGVEPTVALMRLQRGEIDLLGDGIPSARFVQVMNDPELSELVAEGDQLHTGYVTINTRIAPFDNVLVRKALNMALNKERIIQVINGRARPANQILPPAMPGYDDEYQGYTYDPEEAKALLAEAGYPDGFSTVLYASNVDPNPRIVQVIQKDLANIGIELELKTLTPSTVIEAGGTEKEVPLLWSGGMAWIADYPDPNNFFWPILGSASATTGGWNWAWYANSEIDKRAAEADTMAAPEDTEQRIELWKEIFTDIMNDAPWIPVFHEKRFTMRSAKIGGPDAIFVDPVHIPVNYAEVYINE